MTVDYSNFFNGAAKGDIEAVQQELNNGADVDYHHMDNKLTVLSLACTKGHLAVVRLLLEHNASVDFEDSQKRTALEQAASHRHFHLIPILLKYHADINHKNKNGDTPLIMAALSGHWDVVLVLLKYGAKVDNADIHGNTALICACLADRWHVAKILLEHKADINHKNNQGTTPLITAVCNGRLAVTRLLLQYKPAVEQRDNNGDIALWIAYTYDRLSVLELLLQKHRYDMDYMQNLGALKWTLKNTTSINCFAAMMCQQFPKGSKGLRDNIREVLTKEFKRAERMYWGFYNAFYRLVNVAAVLVQTENSLTLEQQLRQRLRSLPSDLRKEIFMYVLTGNPIAIKAYDHANKAYETRSKHRMAL